MISKQIAFSILTLFAAFTCEEEDVAIITGGTGVGPGNILSSTEILSLTGQCSPTPALPTKRDDHVTALTDDGVLLTCGGFVNLQCLAFDLETNSWQPHSSLDKERGNSAVLSLQSGLLLIGGYGENANAETSSFLPTGSTSWESGPMVAAPGFAESCAVSVISDSFLMIGGAYDPKKVVQYSYTLEKWEEWPPLEQARKGHACTRFGDQVMVAGGINNEDGFLASAIIMDLGSKEAVETGAMTSPRAFVGLALLDGAIWAFGGADSIDSTSYIYHPLDSVEEWNAETGAWTSRNEKLQEARLQFGFATVPTSLMCGSSSASATPGQVPGGTCPGGTCPF